MRWLPLAVFAVACLDPPTVATGRDPHCWYVGDTITKVRIVDPTTNVAQSCFWLLAIKQDCGSSLVHPVSQRTAGAC